MTEHPPPPVPAECDLTDFQYMELDVRRLRDSKFASTPSAEAFRAGVMLWCAAWHQIPAASLPDDDVELASLAGYGRMSFAVKEWRKVRAEALNGFVLCSDGRLYHSVIAEKAVAAFKSKEAYAYKKFLDRMRKENGAREKQGKPIYGIPTQEQWKSGAYPHGIPPEPVTTSGGIPQENSLRGNGEGEGKGTETISVPNGTGGFTAKPAADLTKDELWWAGKSLLAQAGTPAKQCGSIVGKLVKDYGDTVVIEAVRAAVVARPADPIEYLKATCMHAVGQRSGGRYQTAMGEVENAMANLVPGVASRGSAAAPTGAHAASNQPPIEVEAKHVPFVESC